MRSESRRKGRLAPFLVATLRVGTPVLRRSASRPALPAAGGQQRPMFGSARAAERRKPGVPTQSVATRKVGKKGRSAGTRNESRFERRPPGQGGGSVAAG